MAFDADIIVTSSDGVDLELVVEVKLSDENLDTAEKQLKRYMLGRKCSTGLIVTPSTIRIYRDQYVSYDEDSIACVGEFRTPESLAGEAHALTGDVQTRAFAFESQVQAWLEALIADDGALQALPTELGAAMDEHVVPALYLGDIRAAGPRWRTQARANAGA